MDHNLLDFVTDIIWLRIHLSHQQVINWTTDEFTTNIINFLRKLSKICLYFAGQALYINHGRLDPST